MEPVQVHPNPASRWDPNSVRRRTCFLCQRPREVLFAFPVQEGLAEACILCWYSIEIRQLAGHLEDTDVALDLAAEVLEGVYRRLRARVNELHTLPGNRRS